jgi:hypothetical protein
MWCFYSPQILAMLKNLFLISLISTFSYYASAQVTYLADTAFTTDALGGGGSGSCIYTGGHFYGVENKYPSTYWIADYFVVPMGDTWVFDTVVIFGFQQGIYYDLALYPFQQAYLQIYEGGPPGMGGNVIWGDTVTNIMVSTGFTGIYRTDQDQLSLSGIRYLKLHLSPAPSLTSGTYWLSWACKEYINPASGGVPFPPVCPPKVLPGRINPTGQRGRKDSSGVWSYIIDNGDTLGFNKIIIGSDAISATAIIANRSSATLNQNAPNPFSCSTNISFYLPNSGDVKLSVYNVMGNLVAELIQGELNQGQHSVIFDGGNLPSGMYYYQLSTSTAVETKQMVLEK